MRGELRTFRIDRINDLQILNENYVLPHDFDAKTYLERTMRFENRIDVVVHMDEEAAPQMRERSNDWIRVSDNVDGSVTVRFDVDNLNWATSWVLSWGKLAKALEPPELVARVKQTAQELLKVYENEPEP